MANLRIVRDTADRPATAFGRFYPIASARAVVSHRAPLAASRSDKRRADLAPGASSFRNMAEVKIQLDGEQLLIVFHVGDVSPKNGSGSGAVEMDIHSLVSNTLEKIIDRVRGSEAQPAVSMTMVSSTNIRSFSLDELTVLRVGSLELNLLDRTARRGSRQIDLRPREFRLLRYMMERSEQVLTRAKLLQEVWNYKFVPHTNLVDVHMGRLRRKIDCPNEPQMISCVRGAGFVLNAKPLAQS